VLAGVMGNDELSKFGVVGDAINVASRVEQLTRELDVDLLVTDAVRKDLDGRFRVRAMPPAAVKGKPEPILTYFVEGMSG
jgi:class 3 adenylate cyclase